MRFQSGLGSEFSRVYKEGTRVDQLILAQVLKVHYKYNTVDLITIQNHNVLESAYDTEGKFSAKLPIEFGGRNQFDLPYGQVKPIDVGTIVLVGFINESKEAPIVLSAYANAEVSKQLSRAPFSSADPSDEDLRRDMYQNFTLHPSLTYDSINGDGDRVVTFSGRSFISFTSKDTDNSNITDDNYGSDYFDLESSYYGDGDPIEPVEENAPNMLFKHQGIFDKDDEFDNHKLMIHINNDGTYRTSMLDQTEDWRSMFEMTPEGDIRLRRQGDSLSIGDGFEVGEIGIDKHGKVYLRNGGSELTLEEDGLYVDGEPLSASMSDIWDELEDSNRNILENSQNIENVGDSLTVTSKKVEQQGTSIADMSSEITIMAEEISSKVTRAEVDDILDAGLEDISEEIKSVRENAEWAKSKIDGLLDDNYLEVEEKRDLHTEWNLIQTEYPSYMQQASDLGVGSNDYKKAYEDLESTVEPIFEDMESSMVVDGVLIQNRFNAYYDQRMKLLQSFLSELKDGITEAMKEAADAALDAADAKGDARDAQNAADNANSLIDDIASDGKLTPSEKLQVKREWDTIQREHPSTIEQAEKYNLETLDYENKYNSLESFLEPLLSNLGNTTNVEGEELRKTLADYYEARIDLLKEITDEAKDQLDDYGKRIDVAETNIRQTSERIELIATKVQSVEDDLVTQKGEINVLSDQIQLRVTEDQARNIVQDSMDDLKIGTANLYAVSSQSKGILNDDTGEVETAEDDSVVSTWISVKPNYPYVASLTGNAESRANIITVNFYDSGRSFIEGKSLAEVGDFYMEAVSPNLASYARVSYKYSNDVRIKFESGSKPTDWSMAWDDVLYDSDLLEEYIKDVETQASEAQRAAENAQNDADVANEKIADIGSDGKVTPGEKKTLNMQWEEIQAEYPEIRDQAIRYSLSTTNYTNAFNQVKNYVDDLFEDMEETSNVTGESLRGTFSRYYSARTSLLNQVYEKAEQNAKDYSDTEIAKVGERIQQAEDQIDESNKILVDMSKDDVLSPIDKKSLSKEWEQIQSEYPKLIDQGNKYGVNITDLEASYGALERYLQPVLSQMGENTEIDSREFRSTFKEYYDDKLNLMNSVSDEVRKLGDAAASDAENRANSYTDSQIDITKEGIVLGYKKYTDESSQKVKDNAKSYADNVVDSIDINDRNLIVVNNLKAHTDFTTAPKVEKGGRKIWVKWKTHPGNLIAIKVEGFKPEGLYTLSARIEINGKPVTSNRFPYKKIHTSYQDSQNERFDISDDGRLIATEHFNENDNGYIIYTFMNDMNEGDTVTFYDLKFQKGNKATDWTPAPEDLVEEATNESKKYTDNQISITEEGIKSKVDKDGVISQINQSSEGVLIDGAKHHITGKTEIDNAVITSAMIKDIDASRVTVSANSGKKSVRMTKDGFIGYDSNGKLRLLIGVQDLAGDGQSDPSNVVFYSGNGKRSVSVGTNVDDTFVIGSETSGVTGLVRIPKQLTLESDDVIVMGGTNKSDYGDYWRFGTSTVGGTKHVAITTDRPYAGVIGHSDRFLRKIYTTKADIRRLDVGYGFNNPQEGDFSVRKDSRSGFIMSKVTTSTRTYDVPANVRITRNGVFGKAISASKYKLNIQNLKQEEALDLGNRLLTLNPSKWWSKDEIEGYVSELDGDDDFVDENNVSPYYGMVAEDLRDVGLDPYIEYDEKTGEIEGIQYDRLWTPLIPIIREQRAEIEKLKIEVEKLKRGGDA